MPISTWLFNDSVFTVPWLSDTYTGHCNRLYKKYLLDQCFSRHIKSWYTVEWDGFCGEQELGARSSITLEKHWSSMKTEKLRQGLRCFKGMLDSSCIYISCFMTREIWLVQRTILLKLCNFNISGENKLSIVFRSTIWLFGVHSFQKAWHWVFLQKIWK